MSARASAWMVVFAVCACSLPKGKLVRSDEQEERESSQRPASDAGVDANTGDASPRTERVAQRDAASADLEASKADAASGTGGSVSRKAMAGHTAAGAAGSEISASNKPEPKPNGELCRGNEDCIHRNCKSGDSGERRCHGTLQPEQSCSQPYDCDGYSCVPLTFEGKKSVCVDKGACTMQGTCFADYGIAMCQLEQHCNKKAGSFNQCFKKACTLAGSSNAQCFPALEAQLSLNEGACCPSGGVFNGRCNTAPQCGCADNMKCTIESASGKAACTPIGNVAPGGSCVKAEDCTKGHGCAGGVCKQHCEGPDDTACAGGGACREILFSTEPTGAYVCTRPCDPFDPTSTAAPFLGCAEGYRCNPAPDGKTDCAWTGSITVGSSCDDGMGQVVFNGCGPSLVCVTPKLVCTPFCHVGENDCPSADCRSFGTPRQFVFETEVGYCAPP